MMKIVEVGVSSNILRDHGRGSSVEHSLALGYFEVVKADLGTRLVGLKVRNNTFTWLIP